jgi:predicted kinase
MNRTFVLVSGAPGSGKSTVASKLTPALQMPLIAKDMIKESIWDALSPPAGDLGWSRRVGGAAMELLWALADHSPGAIIEANFRPHSDYERAKLDGLAGHFVEVYCSCPPDIAQKRYAERATRSDHHPAHVTPTLTAELLAEFDQPMNVGDLIEVDTTLQVDIDGLVDEILDRLRQMPMNPTGQVSETKLHPPSSGPRCDDAVNGGSPVTLY